MTDLEKRAEEYVSTMGYNTYESDGHDDYSVQDALVEFVQSETALLSKHILELQKTNGALTDRINELENQNSGVWLGFNEQTNQLTEAKKIIKKFTDCVEHYSIDNTILDEAEQFIKEIKEK